MQAFDVPKFFPSEVKNVALVLLGRTAIVSIRSPLLSESFDVATSTPQSCQDASKMSLTLAFSSNRVLGFVGVQSLISTINQSNLKLEESMDVRSRS